MRSLGLVAVLLLASACGAQPPAEEGEAPMTLADVAGATWQLQSMTRGGTTTDIPKEVAITFRVEPNGRVSGRSAVNRYFLTMTMADDGTLALESGGAIGSTRMAGPPEHMALETQYLAALAAVTRAAKTDKTLTLTGTDTELVFAPES